MTSSPFGLSLLCGILVLSAVWLANATETNVFVEPRIWFVKVPGEATLIGLCPAPRSEGISIYSKNADPNATGLVVSTLYWINGDFRGSIELKNRDGIIIKKTKNCRQMETPLSPTTITYWNNRKFVYIVHSGQSSLPCGSTINLRRLFTIETDGFYTVTLRPQIYKRINGDELFPVTLPPISVPIWLSKPKPTEHDSNRARSVLGGAVLLMVAAYVLFRLFFKRSVV